MTGLTLTGLVGDTDLAGVPGRALCGVLAGAADRWLGSLLPFVPDVALVAVGGYGRRELCPGSDLDVLLVHRGVRGIAEIADRLWYPVWDAGIGLDHSVRTVREALSVAEGDLKTQLGLLDGRWIAGDRELADDVVGKAIAQWQRYGRRRLEELGDSVDERHRLSGEVAFLLEPDLKEGRGGLRDVAALRAAAMISPVVDARAPSLVAAAWRLLDVRVELQRGSGKEQNVLLLQDQDAVAAALGFDDEAGGADALMAAVAAAGRTIGWASDDGWLRVRSWLAGPNRRSRADRPVGPGLVLRDGEIAIAPGAAVGADASLALRAGVASAEAGVPIARRTLDRLADEVPPPGDPWSDGCRNALVALLGSGPAAIPVLETLDQLGLWVRVLPEWAPVRSRPQRNAYHRFTVDRHLWETAANAAALTRQVARPDLLLVGALLHDIGKGVSGRDHVDAGLELMTTIGTRMGFPPSDVDVLCAMVRHHLLLPDIATRRDLDDPRTISMVAEMVGDTDTLDLLAALTEADSIATGPSAWGGWKEGLVAELVLRVRVELELDEDERSAGGPPVGVALFPGTTERALLAAGRFDLVAEGSRVTVVAPDRPGLLSRVAGTLALRGVDVRAAHIAGDGAMAVEVFDVEPALDRFPDWDRVRDDVALALEDRLALEAGLEERARAYASRFQRLAAAPAEPLVLFDDDASDTATVIEVRAPDGVGVLYRITRALAECGLDVRSAKVATLGHEVVDSFYVNPVPESERQRVESAILRSLHR